MLKTQSLLTAADHYLRAAIQAAHEHRGSDVAYLLGLARELRDRAEGGAR